MTLPELLARCDPASPNYAVEVVDAVLRLAVDRGASDVHLQPRREAVEVLFRIDGVLQPIGRLPAGASTDPAARLMVLAGLPTYRASQPQEGRLKHEQLAVELRVGLFPTLFGQRCVIRLLPERPQLQNLDALGFDPDTTAVLDELTRATDGAVLLTGPAGSGKTTTLYASLREIAGRRPMRSIVTMEDPIEAVLPGVSQSAVEAAGAMTLAAALRSAVRQDPEVLMVSEVRDPETAEAALQASLSGHLVYSSLHAGDCITAVQRLIQMELPAYLIRSGVRALVSQRLLRTRCRACPSEADPACSACHGSGYAGRMVIAELLRFDDGDPVGEVVGPLIESPTPARRIAQQARDAGMVTLAMRAWQAVSAGHTDAAEVFRVLGRDAK